MLAKMKSAVKLVVQPKKYAQGASYDNRIRFHNFFKWIDGQRSVRRQQILKEVTTPKPLLAIPEHTGFRKIEDFDTSLLKNVKEAACELIKTFDLKKLHQESDNKALVSIRLTPDADPKSPFIQFALHPSIIKMVGDYLGMLPVIEDIMIWYSPNEANIERSAQYYHLDAQDVRTVQMFLLIEDVDANTGPFVFIQADESERLARKINYRKIGAMKRLDDEVIDREADKNKIHKVVDKAGSLYIVDTDRCFHYGSRKASKPRFMVTIQYYTPYAFAVPFKWWKKVPYANSPYLPQYNEWQRLVLGAPR